MKRISVLLLLFLSLLLFFSCATSIPVQMTVPPKMDYQGARSVGVLPFSSSSEDAAQISRGLNSYFSWYQRRTLTSELKLAAYISSKVESTLASTDFFKVISSAQLQDQVAAGNLAVDAIVTGKLTSVQDDQTDEYTEKTDSNGVVTGVITYTRTSKISVTFTILSATDLSILDTIDAVQEAKSVSTDYSSLDSYETLQYEAADEILEQVKYQLIPRTYTEYRTMEKLANDKDPRVEKIDQLIDGGFYQDAYDLYMDIYRETSDWAALYNSILLVEVMGDYDRAIEEMTQLAKDSGNKKAVSQMNRMIQQKQNREAMAN